MIHGPPRAARARSSRLSVDSSGDGMRPRMLQRHRPAMAIAKEVARWLGVWALAATCAACSGGASHWDGLRGYDGRGDYGYDVAASNAEALNYRGRAALSYEQP